MNGGEGPHSYLQNSSLQINAFEAQKKLIEEAIANNFNPIMTHFGHPTNLICIADLGCSTGPTTFMAIQTITQAIQNYYHATTHKLLLSSSDQTLEFSVFFNDQVSNDFNTLFKHLPDLKNKTYFAFGLPGSFHGRLFPKQTLHFVHSALTLHYLSKVPKEIMNRRSSAWNKGRIHYTNAPKEVRDAYEAQFKEDFESFLDARAQEVVGNGLMALQIATAPDHMAIESSDIDPARVFELLGSSLMDLAKAGIIREEKVDSFNLPIFYSPIKGVKKIVERNEFFSIERMEELKVENFYEFPNANKFVSLYRATVEDMIEKHFGEAIIDDLFDRFTQKVLEFPDIMNTNNLKLVMLFLLLKRHILGPPPNGTFKNGGISLSNLEGSNLSVPTWNIIWKNVHALDHKSEPLSHLSHTFGVLNAHEDPGGYGHCEKLMKAMNLNF
ncbi:putative S-adenosylmethionine-dependent methyltransferase At5g37990 [Senna tora]|uniref:Putative S-adenosylmethionine-dependent methyltransferase At5g37990 n=1 Tax=Senna tora TaxID=362788 RepID=A0A834TWL6_9FABA|nr:putative S-adenosylmethionine-dependent methyltransferase At5g37990 [Senna tora]